MLTIQQTKVQILNFENNDNNNKHLFLFCYMELFVC